MFELLNIPETFTFNKAIALEKIYGGKAPTEVESIVWRASIKEALSGKSAVVDKHIRCEEVQVIEVKVSDSSTIFDVCRPIYKAIKYPCILIINHNDKFLMATCPFTPGQLDYQSNILRSLRFSHWMVPEILSPAGEKFIAAVNGILSESADLFELYSRINNEVQDFPLLGITKAHVSRLVQDMTGKKEVPHLLDSCTPYLKHSPTENSKRAKYNRNMRTSTYIYRFDTEDLWYAFWRNEAIRRVIQGRRYRDMEDLIRTIDEKLEDAMSMDEMIIGQVKQML